MATMTERKNNDLRDTELLVKAAPVKKARNLKKAAIVAVGMVMILAGVDAVVRGAPAPALGAFVAMFAGAILLKVSQKRQKK